MDALLETQAAPTGALTPPRFALVGSAATLQIGSLFGGRYEISALIGEGGMGAVYKAHDREVDRVVAIKVIRPELAGSREILQRFKQELVLARQVTHRNVVRIYDLGVAEDITFIIMEYVEGRELAEILDEAGKLPPKEAANIMLQVCYGLAAAHREGVVHRDLKPENIMIDANNRAIVMDFGIAHSGASSAHVPATNPGLAGPTLQKAGLTQAGSLLGTPKYMSPEQARRQTADARSDIFTAGLIFFEILTGHVPFLGKTVIETLNKRSQIVSERPVVSSSDEIPRPVLEIVHKCMERDPSRRYQTADELIHALEVWLEVPGAVASPRYWRWITWAFATLILVLGFVVYKERFGSGAPAGPHPPVKILVADVANHTGNPVFDGTLEPAFNLAMEGATFITAYNRGQAQKLADRLKGSPTTLDKNNARLVALREGVDVVVVGDISPHGDGFRITAEASDASRGNVIASESANAGSKDEVLLTVAKVAAKLRGALGDATPESAQSEAAETFSSSSLEAVQKYANAQQLQWKGEWEQAIDAYREVIKLDPNMGRAYAGLAVALANLGRQQEAEENYKQALSRIDRMSNREKYRTRGGYYLLKRDTNKAIEQFQALVKQYPADTAGLANLGLAYFYARNMTGALEQGRRALAIYPNNLLQLNNLGLFAMYAGDFDSAIAESKKVIAKNPAFWKAYVCMALSQLGLGHTEDAMRSYATLATFGAVGASQSAAGLADLAMYEGRFADAVKILEPAIANDLAAHDTGAAAAKRVMLAQASLKTGKKSAAIAAADAAVAGGMDENLLYPAAMVFLDGGVPSKALALGDELTKRFEPDPQVYGKLIQGEIKLRKGDTREAIKIFEDAQKITDTWMGRFSLGRAYLEAASYTNADTELDTCLQRRGEVAAAFLDERPTFHYLPAVQYYLGRAREGLGSSGALDSYKAYLAMKQKSDHDPMVEDARKRVNAAH